MEKQEQEMEIIHSDACNTAPIRKKCKTCRNKYKAERLRKTRMEKKLN